MIGKLPGHYRILEKFSAGGMGVQASPVFPQEMDV